MASSQRWKLYRSTVLVRRCRLCDQIEFSLRVTSFTIFDLLERCLKLVCQAKLGGQTAHCKASAKPYVILKCHPVFPYRGLELELPCLETHHFDPLGISQTICFMSSGLLCPFSLMSSDVF